MVVTIEYPLLNTHVNIREKWLACGKYDPFSKRHDKRAYEVSDSAQLNFSWIIIPS